MENDARVRRGHIRVEILIPPYSRHAFACGSDIPSSALWQLSWRFFRYTKRMCLGEKLDIAGETCPRVARLRNRRLRVTPFRF